MQVITTQGIFNTNMRTFWLSLFTAIIAVSCSTYHPKELSFFSSNAKETRRISLKNNDSLEVTYLGCGGLKISYHQSDILIDPFFSNQGPFYSLPLKKISVDTPSVLSNTKTWSPPKFILTTHAHYDHIMDIPVLVDSVFHHQTTIFGNKQTISILKNFQVPDSLCNSITTDQLNKWVEINEQLRFMPLAYGHAPHMRIFGLPLNFMAKHRDSLSTPPKRTKDFPEGDCLAYVLEFRNDEKSVFRILLMNGSASEKLDINAIPKGSIDLAVFCVASHNFTKTNAYPTNYIQTLNPKNILFVHWENFFKPHSHQPQKAVPFTNFRSLNKKLKMSTYNPENILMMNPMSTVTYHFYNTENEAIATTPQR